MLRNPKMDCCKERFVYLRYRLTSPENFTNPVLDIASSAYTGVPRRRNRPKCLRCLFPSNRQTRGRHRLLAPLF